MPKLDSVRQPKPVTLLFEGGDLEDRQYWMARVESYLNNQPCQTQRLGAEPFVQMLRIYPNAVND